MYCVGYRINKEVVKLKEIDIIKKYILFIICSALTVGAATYYFHTAYKKKNTTTVIIDNSTDNDNITTAAPTESQINKSSGSHTKTTENTSKTSSAPTISETEFIIVDINTANADELKRISGIGDKLAGEIIRYREENGNFSNIEEITKVHGIGEKIFADIRDHIYVADPVYPDITQVIQTEKAENSNEIITEYKPTLEDVSPININTADIELLVLLPHIDEETALQIIDFRTKNDGFSNEYELLLIDGLTRSKVSDIMKYIEIK